LAARAAYARAKLGQLEQAAVILEHSRATLISGALSEDLADLDRLTARGHDGLHQQYALAAARLEELEQAEKADRQALQTARGELDKAISAVRHTPGFESFRARLNFREILRAAGSSALVFITYTEVGGMALLVRRRAGTRPDITVIWLDKLDESAVMEQILAYGRASDARQSRQPAPGAQSWLGTIDGIGRWLWEALMSPLISALDTGHVALIPGRILGLLPLHIAWHEDASMTTGRRYALDDVLITYTPSAQALLQSPRDATSPFSILAVADTSLPNSLPESASATRWFPQSTYLSKDETSLAAIKAALRGKSVLNFSCHGSADLLNPLSSNIKAANNGDLTVRDIYELQLPGTRLAVLSACETSVPGANTPDEAIGLPSFLLRAGVQGVIG
jgi:CHAT domain-containing protein